MIHSANDKEDERFSYDSIVSDRALREIYMMPFMLAQKYARPWAIMTAWVPPVTRFRDVCLSQSRTTATTALTAPMWQRARTCCKISSAKSGDSTGCS